MRVWTAQPKVMTPIVNDPNMTLRVQPGVSTANQPMFTVVAMQTSENGNPIHTALAVFTNEGEARRFLQPAKPKKQSARFANTITLPPAVAA